MVTWYTTPTKKVQQQNRPDPTLKKKQLDAPDIKLAGCLGDRPISGKISGLILNLLYPAGLRVYKRLDIRSICSSHYMIWNQVFTDRKLKIDDNMYHLCSFYFIWYNFRNMSGRKCCEYFFLIVLNLAIHCY